MIAIRRIGANSGFFLALLVFVTAIGGGAGFTIQRLRTEAINAHLDSSAMYAHVFEDHLTQTFKFVNFVLAQTLETELLKQKPAKISALLSKTLRQTPVLRSLSLVDAHGRIIASSNPANIGLTISDHDYLPPPSNKTEDFAIGPLWSGRDFNNGAPAVSTQSVCPEALPGFIPVIYSLRQRNQGLNLLAAVNPDYLINNFSQKLAPEQGFTEVLRDDGKLLLSSREHPGATTSSTLMQKLAENETGRLEETLPDNTAVLTAYRASSQFPLLVVTRLYRDHALQKWAEEKRLLSLIVFPSLLLVALLSTLLYVRERRIAIQKVEARQREHERLAATVFATVDKAVMVTNAERRIIEVNPAFSSITGFSPAEVIGQNPAILSSGRHPPEFFQKIYQTLAETGSWHGEIWNRHKNGRHYIEWLSIKQVHNEHGLLTHYVAAFSDITDRKQAEKAQLHSILEASPEAVLLVDSEGSICFANRIAERIFAYSQEEFSQLSIEALVPEHGRAGHPQHRSGFAQRPRSRPMASGIKLSALCKNGHEFPAEISLSPIRMGDQSFIITAISDISQRIRDEETLRTSEERWKFALEGAGEGVWDWNIVSGQTLFSKRIADFWDSPDGAFENSMATWTDRIHPDDRDFFIAELQAHLDGDTSSFAAEHRFLCQSGRWIWAHGRGMVVCRDASGKPLRMIGTYADISERKKIEADFQDLLQFNQSVIANSYSGIMVHKASGECIMANEAAARIAGGSVEQLLQHNFRTSQSWQQAGAIIAAENALQTGSAIEFESPLQTIFGRQIWCVASFGRLNIKGESYLLSVFNDISARKQAENAMLTAKENAETLLSRARMAERRIVDISEETRKKIGQELHDDLGQHLTGIAFLSEVLFQNLKSHNASEMASAATITELVNEAVAKTRILAQGLYPVELKEAGLLALLAQAARNIESIYKIRCELSTEGNPVISDLNTQINLFRIAQEAINNAIRHGNASAIRLHLAQLEQNICFEIADNGDGFDNISHEMDSSGLGMHTMQYRASLIGATLQIISNQGGGTRVVILLPVA